MPTNVAIGSRTRFAYTEESTWGTTPDTPVMRVIRITGGTLTPGRSLIESAELIADRSTPSPIQGTPFPAMSLSIEMQAKAIGTLIKHLLSDTTTVFPGTLTGTIDLSSGANINADILVVDIDSAVDTITFAQADPIDVATIAGEINTEVGVDVATANGNFLELSSLVDAGTGYAKVLNTGTANLLTTLGLAARTEWNYTRIEASQTLPEGLSMEAGFTDVSLFTTFKGTKMNTWSVDITPNAVVTGTFEALSREGGEEYTSTAVGTAYTEDFSDKFDSFTGELLIDGVSETRLRSLSFSVTNNMQEDFVTVYTKIRDALPEGRRTVNGNMGIKFDNLDWIDRAKNFTELALTVKMENTVDNRFVRVAFPAIRIQLPNFDIPEGTVDLPIDFIAYKKTGETTDLRVDIGSGEDI